MIFTGPDLSEVQMWELLHWWGYVSEGWLRTFQPRIPAAAITQRTIPHCNCIVEQTGQQIQRHAGKYILPCLDSCFSVISHAATAVDTCASDMKCPYKAGDRCLAVDVVGNSGVEIGQPLDAFMHGSALFFGTILNAGCLNGHAHSSLAS